MNSTSLGEVDNFDIVIIPIATPELTQKNTTMGLRVSTNAEILTDILTYNKCK